MNTHTPLRNDRLSRDIIPDQLRSRSQFYSKFGFWLRLCSCQKQPQDDNSSIHKIYNRDCCSGSRSQWQQAEEVCPDFSTPDHRFQPLLGNTQTFPSQKQEMSLHLLKMCLMQLLQELTMGHPWKVAKPPQVGLSQNC